MEHYTSINDAELIYIPNFCENPNKQLDDIIQNVNWTRFRNTERFVASFGKEYSYSGITHGACDIPLFLHELYNNVQYCTNEKYNSILLNLYPNNKSSIGWHSDNEPELGHNPKIASISLGQCRQFLLRNNKSLKTYDIRLEHGSLLFMGSNTQQLYQHSIAKEQQPMNPRINLTFRMIK